MRVWRITAVALLVFDIVLFAQANSQAQIGASGVGFALLSIFAWWAFKGRRASDAGREHPQRESFQDREPIHDPDIKTLKAFSEKTGRKSCRIELVVPDLDNPENLKKIECVAELRENNRSPLVHFKPTEFSQDIRPVKWTKRIPKAAEMLGCAKKGRAARNQIAAS